MVRALVRQPSPRLADGIVTHIDRQPVDVDLAQRQWDDYVALLERAGWPAIEVPAAPEHPDSVFVEDTMVVRGDLAVIARPGATKRRAEVPAAAVTIAGLGYRTVPIEAPDTLDGGDVLKIGDRMYVGVGGRTTAGACGQLARATGAEVIPVPLTKVLHLKSAVTALPDGTVIGWPSLLPDRAVFPQFLPVPEESGSHVVILDDDRVLLAASAPATAELLTGRGLRVETVDIGEYEKLEGCVTCLSVRLRG